MRFLVYVLIEDAVSANSEPFSISFDILSLETNEADDSFNAFWYSSLVLSVVFFFERFVV